MKILRIKKQKEFSKILRAGKRAHTEHLTVVWMPSERTRFAVCVGKKYGKSVVRNHIKRLLREAFRAHAHTIAKPCFIMLIPRVGKEYSYSAFEREIAKILKKEKLIEDSSAHSCAAKQTIPQDQGL